MGQGKWSSLVSGESHRLTVALGSSKRSKQLKAVRASRHNTCKLSLTRASCGYVDGRDKHGVANNLLTHDAPRCHDANSANQQLGGRNAHFPEMRGHDAATIGPPSVVTFRHRGL